MSTTKKTATKKGAKKSPAKKAASKKVVKKTTKKAPAKKVVKKTATKKTPTKKATKTAAKSRSKKELVVAPDEASFWVTNGAVLNSLLALRDALDEMEKEVYSYHVSKQHNDFANWVDAVLCDQKCAIELKSARTPEKAKTVVTKHLKVYSV
jgi:hypothetical protein